MFENGLFIFRRDFRIIDNTGLNKLNTLCKQVYTIFIFTPEQVGNQNNFKSDNAVQFMIESLADLEKSIYDKGGRLHCFYGSNTEIVEYLIRLLKIDIVYFNQDYSPYALQRDHSIAKICESKKIAFGSSPDYYLHEPGTIFSGQKTAYQKFTPYYEACLKKKVEQPVTTYKHIKFGTIHNRLPHKITLEEALDKFTKVNPTIAVHGGRINSLLLLKNALKTQKHYSITHNELYKNTTQLSASIKFGCISIREVYKAFKGNHDLIRQLIWRDFYMNILYSFPQVLNGPLKSNYKKIKWRNNESYFKHWKQGTTGFPIVDAGMREMNHTGYMHNRARLIVSSFLVKTLLINWQKGEQYFAKMLTDYDPASNNGNWQWTSGSGADSQPYFRIFNPWEQAKNFDPDCVYIKKWIPELKDVPCKDIHDWDTTYSEYKTIHYSKPIVDYSTQKELALKIYGAAFH